MYSFGSEGAARSDYRRKERFRGNGNARGRSSNADGGERGGPVTGYDIISILSYLRHGEAADFGYSADWLRCVRKQGGFNITYCSYIFEGRPAPRRITFPLPNAIRMSVVQGIRGDTAHQARSLVSYSQRCSLLLYPWRPRVVVFTQSATDYETTVPPIITARRTVRRIQLPGICQAENARCIQRAQRRAG